MATGNHKLTFTEYIRSILSIPVFFTMLLLMTPVILFLLIISLGRFSNFVVEKIAPFIVKPVFWVLGITFSVKKHGETPLAPAVYIFNHSSTLDLITILALGLPGIRFVAKWQFQYNPLFFLLGRLTGQVFIRREKSEKAITTLQKNRARIKRDKLSLLMAPEGSRKHPGVIGPFKKGPFRMAIQLDYPIRPVFFEGNRDLSRGALLFTKKGHCTAHIYPPVDTYGWSVKNLDSEIEKMREKYLQWACVNESEDSISVVR